MRGTLTSKAGVWKMFDRMAPRYDLNNRVISLGLDQSWRHAAARRLVDCGPMDVLDGATGSGDQLFALFNLGIDVRRAVGVDLAENMLVVARDKARRHGLDQRIAFQHADLLDLPFAAASFDAMTVSLGLRNVTDMNQALREAARILRSDGRLLILETGTPANPPMRLAGCIYTRFILPVLGSLVTGMPRSYLYLHKSMVDFPPAEQVCQAMRDAGFNNVTATPFLWGMVSLYEGRKK